MAPLAGSAGPLHGPRARARIRLRPGLVAAAISVAIGSLVLDPGRCRAAEG